MRRLTPLQLECLNYCLANPTHGHVRVAAALKIENSIVAYYRMKSLRRRGLLPPVQYKHTPKGQKARRFDNYLYSLKFVRKQISRLATLLAKEDCTDLSGDFQAIHSSLTIIENTLKEEHPECPTVPSKPSVQN